LKTKETVNLSLQDIKKNLCGSYGDVFIFSENVKTECKVVKTGSSTFDSAIGIGGLPLGRIVEFIGMESSGKSTMAIHAIREAQKLGIICLYLDAEHSLDPTWLKIIGVDTTKLLISQPECAEDALNMVEKAANGGVGLIVLDSIAALVPRVELEGEIGDQSYALLARLLSQSMRKLLKVLYEKETLLICINQLREKMNVVSKYQSNETTPGGRALKHAASVRVDFRRVGWIEKDSVKLGMKIRIKIIKNKMAPPFREGETELYFNRGIDDRPAIIDKAIEFGLIRKSGSWFVYGDIKVQGKETLISMIDMDKLELEIGQQQTPETSVASSPFAAQEFEEE
jgi:recombination protein RecA